MNNISQDQMEEYRRQINQCAESLAVAKNDQVQGFLPEGMTLDMVKLFTDGNLEKRFDKLTDQLDFVAQGWEEEEFEEIIVRYVKELALAAYDTGCTDGERFLVWVSENYTLNDEQQDLVTVQRTRHAVEFVARDLRLEHVRFQERLAMVDRTVEEWGTNENLRILLNPVHVWSTLHTTLLLDEDAELPATVLFYPVGTDMRTAVLEQEGILLVNTMKDRGELSLDDLVFSITDYNREEVAETCRDLAEMGLAAFV